MAGEAVYLSDGPVHDSGRQTLSLGVRGVLALTLEAHGTHRDFHSGHGGNLLPNPAWELVHLLGTMKSPDGRILIEGFEDDVRPIGPEERAAVDALPLDLPGYLAEHRVEQLASHGETPFFDRYMFHPTLNINGFISGYTGPGLKTIIPATASVRDRHPPGRRPARRRRLREGRPRTSRSTRPT